jgi:hypothetical protein
MAPTNNRIKTVAIVGAGGNSGAFMTRALLGTGKHVVTVITRGGSTSDIPAGVHAVKTIDYSNQSSIVDALQGQDALVITLSGLAAKDTQEKLVDAAIEAGVSFILPNEWSPDTANAALVKDVFVFADKPAVRNKIAADGKGKTSYIAITTGFWYEWSLAIPSAYGFDFAKKSVVFFDDGETITNTSTWPQVGRAVAALFSLPIEAEDNAKESLSSLRNQQVYISSFAVSQKDMFESVLRVTNSRAEDWAITYESAKERFASGVAAMKTGDRIGFAKMMYTRVFFKDASGHFEKTKGVANAMLGLPEEEIDEFTAIAMERSKDVHWG